MVSYVLVGSGEILKKMDPVDSARAQVESVQVSDGRLQPSQSHSKFSLLSE